MQGQDKRKRRTSRCADSIRVSHSLLASSGDTINFAEYIEANLKLYAIRSVLHSGQKAT